MNDKHALEPWVKGIHSADNGEPFDVIFGADGGVVVGDDELTAANGRRIVACVNACRGLSTDALEQKEIVAAVGDLLLEADARLTQARDAADIWAKRAVKEASANADLRRQRRELLAALEPFVKAYQLWDGGGAIAHFSSSVVPAHFLAAAEAVAKANGEKPFDTEFHGKTISELQQEAP